MKILLLSETDNVHTRKWVKSLCENGIEVCLFGLAPTKIDFYESIPNLRLETSNFENQYGASILKKVNYLKVVKQLKKIVKSFKPDIVHAHYATSYGLLGSFLNHHPYVISVWGSDVFDFPKSSLINKSLLKRNLKKADYLFSTSHIMAKETKLYTKKHVEVIPFGVDLDKFKKLNIEKDNNTLTIGIVKTLEEKYGIKYLIQAFSKLVDQFPDKNLKLLIVGTGRKKAAYEKLVDQLNLKSHTHFTGRVDHTEIPTYFNQMDIATVPSIIDSESFGVAAVEASACELPVVVSNVGGLPEVVIDGKTGLHSNPGDSEDLANKIASLIQNPDKRIEMGKAGRNFVASNYQWDNNVQSMIEHYQKIKKAFC